MSCYLFTAYIDCTIEAVKSGPDDGWLSDMHLALLMDDSVILATTRESMVNKIRLLKNAADSIGMSINPDKTQFMTTEDDCEPMNVDELQVNNCSSYGYLGSPISMTKIASQVEAHIKKKACDYYKFVSFLSKHHDVPFNVKHHVWKVAFLPSVLYGCETWLSQDLRRVETIYHASVKSLLGVKVSTPNDIVRVELAVGSATGAVKDRQQNFFKSLYQKDFFGGCYIEKAINLCVSGRSPAGRYMMKNFKPVNPTIENMNVSNSIMSLNETRTRVRSNEGTRSKTYLYINPELSYSGIYSGDIEEMDRLAATRVRLSSHKLAIETGRWARIAQEDRKCECSDEVQTEEHVLLRCRLTSNIRIKFNLQNINSIHVFFNEMDKKDVCSLCRLCLKHFDA